MNFDTGQDLDDLVFSGVKTKLRWSPPTVRLYIRNLNKTSVREKSRGVYLLIGWIFPSYSMIFRFCWTWGRLCVVVDSLISAAKVCDCSILLRRFVFRKVEASDWWWAARDHGKGTDGRPSAVSPVVSFPPSFARTRETSGYEAGVIVWFPHGVDRYVMAWLNCGFAKIFCASR